MHRCRALCLLDMVAVRHRVLCAGAEPGARGEAEEALRSTVLDQQTRV